MGKYIRRPPKEVLGYRLSYLNGLSKKHLDRAARLDVPREFVDFAVVLATHGLHCHICDQPIYVREFWLNPGRRSDMHFDHVVSLSRGGTHTYDNVRPAHRWCNLVKELRERGRVK